MKTDKELLELSARAAGEVLMYDTFGCSDDPERVYNYWNPLTNDGDALRLAVKLNLLVGTYSGCVTVWYKVDHLTEHGDDPYAATRRAIVRAAAAIGEKL